MIKSLLLKLAMLSMTIGMVFWARWTPQPSVQDIPSATEKQVIASRTTESEEGESLPAGLSSRNVQSPSRKTMAHTELSTTATHSRLDLNSASAGELESLPGIGPMLAQRVIAFRESVGRFQKIEDLREVKGIGAKKYDRLKSLVTVSPGDSQRETEQRES